MRSVKPKFNLLKRGFKKTAVLLPGWATDYRIFSLLDIPYDYVLTLDFDPLSFENDLLDFIAAKSIEKISLFGWSMGAFVAADFALRQTVKTEELILLGIRSRYGKEALDEIKHKILQNRIAYLYKFYLECFSSNDKEGLSWFKKHLMKAYLNEMKTEDLIRGLDYLCRSSIDPSSLSGIRQLRIFQGTEDKIAPFREILHLKTELPEAKFIELKGIGHISFLNKQFMESFNG